MKEKRYDTIGGLTAPILEYESYAEADAVVKDAMLEQGNASMSYRQVLPAVRDLICNKVEADTGVERQSKVVGKTKGGKDILQWEADAKFINRVLAEKNLKDFSNLQGWLDDACRKFSDDDGKTFAPLAVDVKGTERKVGVVGKLGMRYKVIAATKLTAGESAIAAFNKDVLSKIGKTFAPQVLEPGAAPAKMFTDTVTITTPSGDQTVQFNVNDADVENLGRLVKEYLDWVASQAALTL